MDFIPVFQIGYNRDRGSVLDPEKIDFRRNDELWKLMTTQNKKIVIELLKMELDHLEKEI